MQLSENVNGELVERIVIIGEPKLNDKGIQALMHKLNSLLTPHIVQGNMTRDEHHDKVFDLHTDLATDLMENLHTWGVNINDYNDLIDTVVPQLDIFLSRTIDNKEREALIPTMQHIERNDPKTEQPGGISGMLRGITGGGK